MPCGARRATLAVISLMTQALAWGAEPPQAVQGAAAAAPASAPAASPGYVDRVMQGVPAQPDLGDDGGGFDASGAPRTLRVEARLQSTSNDQGDDHAAWISLRGTVDSANYGAFSLDGSLRLFDSSTQQRQGAGASFSLYQNSMPFGGGWFASQGLGVIQTLSPGLAGQQASFFVPTRLIEGASTQWRNEPSGLVVQLSGGQTGSFASIGQGSFYGAGNQVAVLGLEMLPARPARVSLLPDGWSYSALAGHASGSSGQVIPGFGQSAREPAGSGLLQSLRWESPQAFVQGNLLASRNQDPSVGLQAAQAGTYASHGGVWIDGAAQNGATTQRWGLNRLEAGLAWLGTALGGNTQGGYYRWSQTGLRTQVEAQVAALRPIDATLGGSTLNQAGVSVQRRIDQQLGIGGLVQFSGGSTSTLQVSGYSQLRRPWADLRVLAGIETSGGQVSVRRLAADQNWQSLPNELRLSTSQAWSSTSAGAQNVSGAALGNYGTSLQLGVTVAADLDDRLALGLNAQASLPISLQAARIYNVNTSLQWRMAPGWSLSAALALSQASGLTNPTVASPIPGLPGTFTPYVYPAASSRDLWLMLRYDFAAGTAPVPLGVGGRAGVGGGTITGVVYLDDNRNGRLDALEARAANVTVMLDGRYSIRTDTQGRFEFPFVAPGPHAVMVVAETLPLPWMAPAGEPLRVEVAPRETTRVEIGATRDRIGMSDE